MQHDGLRGVVLPKAPTHMRSVEPGLFVVDVDIGEMFMNFFLDPQVRRFVGVDFTKFYPEELDEVKKVIPERCNYCAMGFRPCPFVTIQTLALLEKKKISDRNDLDNVFHWKSLKMNLPGTVGLANPGYTRNAHVMGRLLRTDWYMWMA
jgi:hypothetical protein